MGVYKKIYISPQMSHVQTNYACLLFWSLLGEIHREILFTVKKLTISERST